MNAELYQKYTQLKEATKIALIKRLDDPKFIKKMWADAKSEGYESILQYVDSQSSWLAKREIFA